MLVKAISSFDHNGSRKVGDEFEEPDHVAKQLHDKGLVELLDAGIGAQERGQVDKGDSKPPETNGAAGGRSGRRGTGRQA